MRPMPYDPGVCPNCHGDVCPTYYEAPAPKDSKLRNHALHYRLYSIYFCPGCRRVLKRRLLIPRKVSDYMIEIGAVKVKKK